MMSGNNEQQQQQQQQQRAVDNCCSTDVDSLKKTLREVIHLYMQLYTTNIRPVIKRLFPNKYNYISSLRDQPNFI